MINNFHPARWLTSSFAEASADKVKIVLAWPVIFVFLKLNIFHYLSGMNKTNAARLLDSKGISYELIPYDVDESDLSAQSVALKLGQDVDQVFKTLVLRGDKTGVFICIISGSHELDLKKAARVSGNKYAAMVAMKEIFELTGYIRGGCSPIGTKKKYDTFIDENCILYDHIFVSAGIRGLQLKIATDDLILTTTGEICTLIQT